MSKGMSYDEWISKIRFDDVLPSGLAIIYRKASLIDLAANGTIPINLLATKIQLDLTQDAAAGLELIAKGAELYRAIAALVIIEPEYLLIKDFLSYDDLQYIATIAMGGAIAENLKSTVIESNGTDANSVLVENI